MSEIVKVSRIDDIMSIVEQRRDGLEKISSKAMPVDKAIHLARKALTQSPKLQGCSPKSICTAIANAIQLGLDPTGVNGSAYLVPFKGECVLIPGYRGLIDLARRSGDVLSITAETVHDGDGFEHCLGTVETFEHRKKMNVTRDGTTLQWAYAIARFKALGSPQHELMDRADIIRIKGMSRAASGADSVWNQHPVEMAKKTVIRRLVKKLPMAVEVAHFLEQSEEVEFGWSERRRLVGPHHEITDPVDADEEQKGSMADEIKEVMSQM